MTAVQILLGFVLLQRLVELWLAKRNTTRLLAEGGIEHGAQQYPYFVVLHAAWLTALVLLTPQHAALDPVWLAIFILLQLCRVWVIASLGRFWTTRIITVPNAPLVRTGPYRFMRHPNYAVVIGEIAVLPLVVGQWEIAVVFSVLNAILLYDRIRSENAVLAERRPLD